MGNLILPDGKAIRVFASSKSWIDEASFSQLKHISTLAHVEAIAGMPDLHPGAYGPVGCVVETNNIIYPDLIGTDIGCGMSFWKTDLLAHRLKLDKTVERLLRLEVYDEEERSLLIKECGLVEHSLFSPFLQSLGTIGGGNHFCEVQIVHEIFNKEQVKRMGIEKSSVFLLIHTGSRGLGAHIHAQFQRPHNLGLMLSEDGQNYMEYHNLALHYARCNRFMVAQHALKLLRSEGELISDIPHNFAEVSGTKVRHRKGAATAQQGIVAIPGSRGDLTYLVQPNNNKDDEALGSLAHGAGRRYERSSMAGRIRKNATSLESLKKNPFGGRVICEDKKLLMEEAPLAYKDINKVIQDLSFFSLAQPLLSLKPFITYKVPEAKQFKGPIQRKGRRGDV